MRSDSTPLKADNTYSGRRSPPAQARDDFVLEPPDKVKDRAKDRGISDRSPDLPFIKQVLDSDESATRALRARHSAQLKATLCKRGASSTEAEDLLADLWADCFGSSGEPLLLKYEGRCQPMQGFMFALCYFHTLYTRLQQGGQRKLLADLFDSGFIGKTGV